MRFVLWVGLFLTACGGDDGGGGGGDADGGPRPDGREPGGHCETNADCDDGVFCNGEELCAAAAEGDGCVAGAPVSCDDGVVCTEDSCDETARACRYAGPDLDGDGHGDAACIGSEGSPVGDDCNDADALAFPGNMEVCDGHDEDCNPDTVGFVDADSDGAGSSACCNAGSCGPDCDDTNEMIGPSVPDGPPGACDSLDNDCDGTADEGCPCTDGRDRPCGPEPSLMMIGACRPGAQFCVGGMWTEGCPDAIGPAPELCNSIDDDCDATVDEGVTRTFYRDVDGDGYGIMGETAMACSAPPGYAANPEDCNDTLPGVNPAAPEVCNGRDDNCVMGTDEGLVRAFYRDTDGDGFGNPSMMMMACTAPAGHVTSNTDCNDMAAAINPAAVETCDGADNNCDGTMDPGCACRDGMTRMCGTTDTGECAIGTQRCTDGAWGVCVGGVEMRAELCNGLDDDCDGMNDDGFACRLGQSMACTTACMTAGTSVCRADCMAFEQCRTTGEGPAIAGTCNACDDDGDGAVDDGFTCIQNRPETCLVMDCGTIGQRACNSTCTGYSQCAATAESCNYCDDNRNGTFEEDRGLALSSQDLDEADCARTGAFVLGGDAVCEAVALGFSVTSRRIRLTALGSTDQEGSAKFSQRLRLGWGSTFFRVRMVAQDTAGTEVPEHGWAALILKDDRTMPFMTATGGDALGVPYGREGIAVEWRFSPGVLTADTITVRRLTGSGTGTVLTTYTVPTGLTTLQRLDAGTNADVAQNVNIRYTPEDATTPGTEETLTIERDDGTDIFVYSPPAAVNIFRTGDTLEYGTVATSVDRFASTALVAMAVATVALGGDTTAQTYPTVFTACPSF